MIIAYGALSWAFHGVVNTFRKPSFLWIRRNVDFFWLGFTPCKVEQPLLGMELQEKEAQEG